MLTKLFYGLLLLLSSSVYVDSLQCYRCTEEYKSPFNLTITAENFPSFGPTCNLTEAKHQCFSKIFVFLNNNVTTQTIISYGFDPMSDTDPTIISPGHYVRLGVSRQLIEVTWLKSIQYNCIEDGCNSADNMKRVLKSTTHLTHDFEKLDSLIAPIPNFNSSSCVDMSYMPTIPCEPSVPANKCGQCKLMFYTVHNETCARCVEFSSGYANSVTRHTIFRLSDRSQSDQFDMQCSVQNCNSPSNADRIIETSTLIFDVNEFLGSKAVSSSFSSYIYLFILISFLNKI
ncbi:hypothetical protein I4U23_019970 [Adineta vaga]|nr:hypothetical protein I4U23_019970 [Adineta vaga]